MSIKRVAFLAIAVGTLLFLGIFVATSLVIGDGVRQNCIRAQNIYGGDCVEALTSHLDDENNPYGERNSAIWALGQLGDSRALPVLGKYYTGDIPDREPWNGTISQYELKKAIKLAKGSFNITAFVWR